MSKLGNLVTNDVVKKTVYDKLVTKVNNIDTSDFALNTNYQTDKTKIENKIPETSGLVKKPDYNTNIAEIDGKIPDISKLATKTALTTAENKVPDLVILLIKQVIILKLQKLKRNLLTVIMTNILQLHSLIN